MVLQAYKSYLIKPNIPDWHFSMINDVNRNKVYYQALKKIAKDKVVLDLGAGTCLLSMMALKAGAKKVFAVEKNSTLVKLAKEIVQNNNLSSSKISIINSDLFNLKPSRDIDTSIDLIVTEIFDCGLIGENCLKSISYAKSFLKPGGDIIPQKGNIYACLISSKKLRRKQFPLDKIQNFDLSILSELRYNGVMDKISNYSDCIVVSDNELVASLNFNQAFSHTLQAVVTFNVKQSAIIDSMVIWFRLKLLEDIYFDSRQSAGSHWDQWFLFPKYPIEVSEGNKLVVTVDNRIGKLVAVKWEVII